MPNRVLRVVSLVLAIGLSIGCAPSFSDNCHLSKQEIRKALLQDVNTFDHSDKGWRAYGDDLGLPSSCYLSAARLIDLYGKDHPEISADARSSLTFHAGQCYAMANAYKQAIARFAHSYDEKNDEWNCYVRASIAFLQGDKDALAEERKTLSGTKDKTNLHVVDAFVRCSNLSYAEAYSNAAAEQEKAQKQVHEQKTVSEHVATKQD